MAAAIIKRSDLPDLRRAAVSSCSIRDNGQFSISKLALEKLKGSKYAVVTYDEGSRKLGVQLIDKVPAKMREEDLFSVSTGSKAGGAQFSCAALWHQLGYDYRASGTQIWREGEKEGLSCTISEKGTISFVLPKGALEKRVVRKRTKKTDTELEAIQEAKDEAPDEAETGEGDDVEL